MMGCNDWGGTAFALPFACGSLMSCYTSSSNTSFSLVFFLRISMLWSNFFQKIFSHLVVSFGHCEPIDANHASEDMFF